MRRTSQKRNSSCIFTIYKSVSIICLVFWLQRRSENYRWVCRKNSKTHYLLRFSLFEDSVLSNFKKFMDLFVVNTIVWQDYDYLMIIMRLLCEWSYLDYSSEKQIQVFSFSCSLIMPWYFLIHTFFIFTREKFMRNFKLFWKKKKNE